MNLCKRIIFIAITFLVIITIINCDGNAIAEALKKRDALLFSNTDNYYQFEIKNVTATQIFGTKNILLSWQNPSDSEFSKVIVVRKENSFATSIADPNIKFIYQGNDNNFIDTDLSGDTVYY
ncbi:MAG TPA: hypothetical protein PLE45_01535 [Spirochaetota bacterium]|mgnify:FL=1|nr:hypothetical protein [Spirochaetota bacterium]HOL56644.1 hypothetical protein [Spirochaetota bacterium]HPP03734.1 hypothetical protein [Spirochaetota bacterium]